MTSRREFLLSGAGLFALGCVRTAGSGTALRTAGMSMASSGVPRLPIGFSTLGCPGWSWNRIVDFAAAHGFPAIELRGIGDAMDLTRVPELGEGLRSTRGQLARDGIRVVSLGSSAEMHQRDVAKRAAGLDEARRFIDLAHELHADYVRVFGNAFSPDESRDATLSRVAEGLRSLGEHAQGSGVTVLLESHGDFVHSPLLLDLMKRVNSPSVALLWDAHHTFAFGKEEPEDTVRQLGPYIRHTHLKDSVAAGDDRRYVLTGTGQVPVQRQVAALVRSGYGGYYNFEWEKRWHPEIEEPEVAFVQYAEVMTRYLHDAGVGRT